jgi:hypothetical protein
MAGGYDHDHETDRVRAALCQHHNATLGASGDTPTSLRTIADWLESADMGFSYSDAVTALKRVSNRRRYDAFTSEQRRAAHYDEYTKQREYYVEYARQRRIKLLLI